MTATRPICCSSYVPQQEGAPVRGLLMAVVGYIALIGLGFAALRLPGVMIRGNELSPTAAWFMSINATTLTGFDPATPLAQYTVAGRLIILVLMAGGSLLSLLIGGVAVGRIIDLPHSPRRIATFTAAVYGALLLIGTLGLAGPGRTILDALLLACSALGNVGLAASALPAVDQWQTHAVLLPLAVLGGLGSPIWLNVWDRLVGRSRRLSNYSTIVLTVTAAIYLIGVLPAVLVAAGEGTGSHWLAASARAMRAAAIDTSATVLNARTAGFSFAYADQFPRYAQWLLIGFMLIGGASGGTAGGLKVNTLAELWRGGRRALAGIPVGRAFGLALAWTGAYVLILAAAQTVLVWTEPQIPADRMLFEVVSALANVGLSFGAVSLVGPGMYVLCAVMLLGRLLPLLLLIWMMQTTRDADVAVG